jgi:eukaryotic-like serine/threonine-protein kinase
MVEAIQIPKSRIEAVSTDAGGLLQTRLGVLAKVMFIVTVIASLLEVVAGLASGHPERIASPLHVLNAVGTLFIVALWWTCRSGPRSARLLYSVEAVVLVGSAAMFCIAGRYLNQDVLSHMARATPWRGGPAAGLVTGLIQHYVSMAMALSLTQVMAARAAVVPSSARHTLALMGAVGLPLLLISGLGWVPFAADRELRQITRPGDTLVISALLLVWWGISAIVCALISRVVHTLRKEVRQAQRLGQYTLQQKLGEGGMGVVYRAHHAMMRRPTAVKLLPPDRAEPEAVARFEREVQLTSQLTHPNTITIFDYGRTPDGVFYYAMELLDGATLEEVVAIDGPQPPERAIHVLSMVAGALSEAHGLGLIHRDIKPANIFLCERGGESDVAKVLDFGLVKSVTMSGDPALTQAGSIAGTPLYMSPEALIAKDSMDARSDLYAVGAVGYFLLTGHHVFEAKTLLEVCGHHMHTVPLAPCQRLGGPVPADLEAVVMQCLEKDPARRPHSALELRARLRECRCATLWSQERARAWWADRGAKFKTSRKPQPIEFGTTLAVDPSRSACSEPSHARDRDTRAAS